MTSVVDKYYRKISENIDNVRMKFDISSLLVKTKELDNKIENTYNKSDIDSKMDLIYSKKDTDDILINIDSKFYSKKYLDNELNNYYYKNNIDDKISNLYDNYYDKNHLNLQFSNLYNRNYLDNKFDDIYTKTDVNDINSKLNRNINIFNTNLTKHINKYSNEKKIIDEGIKENKDNLNSFIMNTFSNFNTNVSNLNNTQNSRLKQLEENKITDVQKNKINSLENIDLNKITSSYNFSVFNKNRVDKLRYYTKEFILHNIDLNKTFKLDSSINEILVTQMELDQRTFEVDDVFKFYLNILIEFSNQKSMYYTLYMRFDISYDDQTLIKSFKRYMTSKGSVYLSTGTFNICRIFKILKKTEKIIFKIYFVKVNTSNKNLIQFDLINKYENNYLDLEWMSII